jgi:hypothetical protein
VFNILKDEDLFNLINLYNAIDFPFIIVLEGVKVWS